MSEKEFNKVFSKRLRYYLSNNGMTRRELAQRLGVSATSVTNWCNGLKSPRMDKVDDMCSLFSCTRSDLVEDKQPAAPAADQVLGADSMNKLSQLDEYGVTAVVDTIDREYSRCISQYREKERSSSNSRLA